MALIGKPDYLVTGNTLCLALRPFSQPSALSHRREGTIRKASHHAAGSLPLDLGNPAWNRDNATRPNAAFRSDCVKLPNQENATVAREKVVDYLLSTTHRDGRHRAVFFGGFGFAPDDWQALAEALIRHASDHEVAKEEDSPFGTRYVVEGIMLMVDGRTAYVRTVWFIDNGADTPRFVTAYPLRG
jgi:hypothetical protein